MANLSNNLIEALETIKSENLTDKQKYEIWEKKQDDLEFSENCFWVKFHKIAGTGYKKKSDQIDAIKDLFVSFELWQDLRQADQTKKKN